MKYKETFDKYQPHCTIAYVKKGEAAQFSGNTFVEVVEIIFDKLVFINDKDKEFEIKL